MLVILVCYKFETDISILEIIYAYAHIKKEKVGSCIKFCCLAEAYIE